MLSENIKLKIVRNLLIIFDNSIFINFIRKRPISMRKSRVLRIDNYIILALTYLVKCFIIFLLNFIFYKTT